MNQNQKAALKKTREDVFQPLQLIGLTSRKDRPKLYVCWKWEPSEGVGVNRNGNLDYFPVIGGIIESHN